MTSVTLLSKTPINSGTADPWCALMADAQDGDGRAYGRLLREITPYLRAQIRRFLRGEEEIEDVVQEILLTVHRVRHTYDPARPFRPWLIAIARRRVIDRLRSRTRRDAHEKVLAPDDDVFARLTAAQPDEPEDHSALLLAVAALPPGQRLAVELLKLQDLSLKEAAAKSGMTIGALKVAGHRAYKALRAALARPDGDDRSGG